MTLLGPTRRSSRPVPQAAPATERRRRRTDCVTHEVARQAMLLGILACSLRAEHRSTGSMTRSWATEPTWPRDTPKGHSGVSPRTSWAPSRLGRRILHRRIGAPRAHWSEHSSSATGHPPAGWGRLLAPRRARRSGQSESSTITSSLTDKIASSSRSAASLTSMDRTTRRRSR